MERSRGSSRKPPVPKISESPLGSGLPRSKIEAKQNGAERINKAENRGRVSPRPGASQSETSRYNTSSPQVSRSGAAKRTSTSEFLESPTSPPQVSRSGAAKLTSTSEFLESPASPPQVSRSGAAKLTSTSEFLEYPRSPPQVSRSGAAKRISASEFLESPRSPRGLELHWHHSHWNHSHWNTLRPTSPRLKVREMLPSESCPSFGPFKSAQPGTQGPWSPRSPRSGTRSPRSSQYPSMYHAGSPGLLAKKYAEVSQNSVQNVNYVRKCINGKIEEMNGKAAQPDSKASMTKGAGQAALQSTTGGSRARDLSPLEKSKKNTMYGNAAQSPTSFAKQTRGVVVSPDFFCRAH